MNYELRMASNRHSIISSLLHTTWNYKLCIYFLISAAILNATLILALPGNSIGNITFTALNTFYYKITSTFIGFVGIICIPEQCPAPIPIFQLSLVYTSNFHFCYWVMVGLLFIGGSGLLIKPQNDMKALLRSYYTINFVILLIGIIMTLNVNSLNSSWEYPANNFNHNVITLCLFLTFIPILLMLPNHLLLCLNKKQKIPLNLTNMFPTKKKFLKISFMIISTILIALIYLGIQRLIW